MDCDTTTRAATTHPDATERPTNVAIRRVLARGVPDCAIATVFAFARNANVATARDVHRFPGKLRRGELFTFVKWSTVADRTGQGYATVKRHVRPWKDSGAVEVRQVSRTMRLMVFAPEPASEPASEPAVLNHVREPRDEPARSREPWTVCYRCGGGWPSKRGYRCRTCERDTRDPCVSPLTNVYGDSIRCTRCYTCRPDRTRCTETRSTDGEPCVYASGHDGQHRVARSTSLLDAARGKPL